jgi:hypothetical protein
MLQEACRCEFERIEQLCTNGSGSERFPVVEGTKAVRARWRRWSVLARSDDAARVVCLSVGPDQTDES